MRGQARRLTLAVDSFQGQERDVRHINVGMTRAQRKLLLVGDSSTLCMHPFFGELLAYVKGVGGYRTALEMAWVRRRVFVDSKADV